LGIKPKLMIFFKRKVIVHFHTFKNAGTTVDSILRKNFGWKVYGLEGPSPASQIGTEEGMKFIIKKRWLVVLTSHQLLYPLPEHKKLSIYSIFFLRHPIDRIGSIYRYERMYEPPLGPSAPVAKTSDFRGYVRWLVDGFGRAGGIKNYQVRRLFYDGNFKKSQSRNLTEKDLNLAKGRLLNAGFFGIVERFDDSLLLMKNYLQNGFPGMEYSYTIQNRSSDIANIEESIKDISDQLGSELYEQILEMNSLDLTLYNYALELFETRILKLKSFANKL